MPRATGKTDGCGPDFCRFLRAWYNTGRNHWYTGRHAEKRGAGGRERTERCGVCEGLRAGGARDALSAERNDGSGGRRGAGAGARRGVGLPRATISERSERVCESWLHCAVLRPALSPEAAAWTAVSRRGCRKPRGFTERGECAAEVGVRRFRETNISRRAFLRRASGFDACGGRWQRGRRVAVAFVSTAPAAPAVAASHGAFSNAADTGILCARNTGPVWVVRGNEGGSETHLRADQVTRGGGRWTR